MDTITRAVSICRFAHISTLSCPPTHTHTHTFSITSEHGTCKYVCIYMFWFRRHCGLLGNMWHLEPNGRACGCGGGGVTVGFVDKVNGQRHDRKNNVAFYFSRQQFAHRTRFVHIIGFAGSTHSHTHIHIDRDTLICCCDCRTHILYAHAEGIFILCRSFQCNSEDISDPMK